MRRIEQRGVFAHHLALAPVGLEQEAHVGVVHPLRRGNPNDGFAACVLANAELQVGRYLVRTYQADPFECFRRSEPHDQLVGLAWVIQGQRDLGHERLVEPRLDLDRAQPDGLGLHGGQRERHRRAKYEISCGTRSETLRHRCTLPNLHTAARPFMRIHMTTRAQVGASYTLSPAILQSGRRSRRRPCGCCRTRSTSRGHADARCPRGCGPRRTGPARPRG